MMGLEDSSNRVLKAGAMMESKRGSRENHKKIK
jgi:hypothetical protein